MPVLANARHERFAQEIAKGKSASEAYRIAGFRPDDGNAIRLTGNDKVQDRIQEILEAGARRAEVTVERVVREYARIGFADIRRAVKWRSLVTEMGEDDETGEPLTRAANEVELIASTEIDEDTALAISEISQTKDGLKVKLHSKLGALDSMARHLGMFVDRSEISHTVSEISDKPVDAAEWAEQHVTAH